MTDNDATARVRLEPDGIKPSFTQFVAFFRGASSVSIRIVTSSLTAGT
ncbi:hypothetical protein J2T08_004872 [Neorhizobium galegae]|nr:hypothetical protein [Neorhizobium galegae]MDQ0136933.1 hypothetical protein [Neorhizobium galegae]